MRAIILSLTTAIAALTFASAAEARHICRGKAHAAGNAIFHVDLEFADDGKPLGRHAAWTPPGEGPAPPLLTINYDLPGDALGSPIAVTAAVAFQVSPQVRANHADIVLSGRMGVLRGPFEPFDQKIAAIRAGGQPSQVMGAVTLATRDRNAALLTKIEQVPTLTLAIEGDQGEHLTSRTFDLTDKAARAALFAQAYAQATEAAKTPLACEAVAN